MCVFVTGQKNIFYDFLRSCLLVENSWTWSGSKVKKHCFLPGSKAKKTFSMIFYFRAYWSKNHGLSQDKKSKKHCFLPGSKVKKTFSMIFYFRAYGSKKHDFGQDQKSKKHCFLSDSKVKKTFSMIFYFRAY